MAGLLAGLTVVDAARSAGISLRTARRRLGEAPFREELRRREADLEERDQRRLSALRGRAIDRLAALIESPHERTALEAAKIALQFQGKWKQADLEERVRRLEEDGEERAR